MELSSAIALINAKNLFTTYPVHWADLGCGTGLFTMALSTVLCKRSSIVAIDKDASALKKVTVLPEVTLQTITADFIKDNLPLHQLDGILMANALHFVEHKKLFIEKVKTYLKPGAPILLVEYDTDVSNPWVPYPLNVKGYEAFFNKMGYAKISVIDHQPSAYRRADIVGMVIE